MIASIEQAHNSHYLVKDYYHSDNERPGVWVGSGAKKLGLQGEVHSEQMVNLWKGYPPEGDKKLVQNAGAKNRRAGWDITFSAPKSVSVAWGVADDKLKTKFEQAQQRAVLDAFQYLEDTAAYTRRGAGGKDAQEKVGLVAATFQHGTSREQDLQLHTHGLTLNIGTRKDGTTGALESHHLYQAKMAAGAVYRGRLSSESQQLGYKLSITEHGTFELSAIPKKARDEFSARSYQIQDYLNEQGIASSPQNKAKAAAESRKAKFHVDDDRLRESWQERAKKHGLTPERLQAARKEVKPLSEFDRRRKQQHMLREALDQSLYYKSAFTERELDRALAENSIGKGLTYADMKAEKQRFFKSKNAIELEGGKDKEFTTKEQLDLEEKLHTHTMNRWQDKSHTVNSQHLFEAISERPTMSKEQRTALTHVVNPGGVKVASGMAGTGKTFFLDAARETWEKSGYTVQGLSLSAKAASGLEEGAKVKSRTVDSFFGSIDYRRAQQEEKPMAVGQQKHSGIGSKTILLVDEAGMVGTKKMTRLFAEADSAGAKVVLIGDARQLQPVQSGGAFQTIARQVGEVELKEIRRQKEDWAKESVHAFADGRAKDALDEFDKRGLLSVAEGKGQLQAKLIDDWAKGDGAKEPQNHLILAQTNDEVKQLNRLAQAKRQELGELKERNAIVGKDRFFEGDRIMFRQNDRDLKVKNGQMGNILRVDNLRKQLIVGLDKSQRVSFSYETYDQFGLGYASTVHKAQGVTVSNSYILAGDGAWDRHTAYVAASRAKDSTKIYAEGDPQKRKAVKEKLSERMSRDAQKQLASDRMKEVRKAREPRRVGQQI
ncbi:conjugal transfer [Leptolyngbya sp. Heron Island J]|nr:MobF family relaxase [Leptolyngbya sp. Heron Island J]ESA36548.1 conjugal transfer [Leptolyngbya sp. Heron Island J]